MTTNGTAGEPSASSPLLSPASRTRAMDGCDTARIACTSARKRSTASGSRLRSGRSSLTATSVPAPGSTFAR